MDNNKKMNFNAIYATRFQAFSYFSSLSHGAKKRQREGFGVGESLPRAGSYPTFAPSLFALRPN